MSTQPDSADFPIPQFASLDRSSLKQVLPQLDAIFRAVVETERAPGVAWGLVADGQLIGSGASGIQTIADRKPVTIDSVFRIASMSKSFTAMAVVKLRDDGKLQLDAPVADIVPELASLKYPTRDTALITVRQLLTMSAGFPQDDPWADRQLAMSEDAFSALLGEGLSFSNPPGVRYEYSNYGYGILGRVVTNASGMPYQQYIKQNILVPLGMTSSTYDVSTVPPERLARGHRREGDAWIDEPPLADGVFGSMGGLLTTVNDFTRYIAFLLSAFPPRDDAETGPIRRSSAREMQQGHRSRALTSTRPTPDAPALVQADSYGYGLVSSLDSLLGYWVAHGGGLPGYGTYYRLLPDCGVGIVALSNATYNSMLPSVHDALVELKRVGALQSRTLAPSSVLTAAQDGLLRLYEQWDDGAAQALATETFFLDLPLEKRRTQFVQLRKTFGNCRSVSALEPENALRGRWVMRCRGGRIEMFATLSPTVPPTVQ